MVPMVAHAVTAGLLMDCPAVPKRATGSLLMERPAGPRRVTGSLLMEPVATKPGITSLHMERPVKPRRVAPRPAMAVRLAAPRQVMQHHQSPRDWEAPHPQTGDYKTGHHQSDPTADPLHSAAQEAQRGGARTASGSEAYGSPQAANRSGGEADEGDEDAALRRSARASLADRPIKLARLGLDHRIEAGPAQVSAIG